MVCHNGNHFVQSFGMLLSPSHGLHFSPHLVFSQRIISTVHPLILSLQEGTVHIFYPLQKSGLNNESFFPIKKTNIMSWQNYFNGPLTWHACVVYCGQNIVELTGIIATCSFWILNLNYAKLALHLKYNGMSQRLGYLYTQKYITFIVLYL